MDFDLATILVVLINLFYMCYGLYKAYEYIDDEFLTYDCLNLFNTIGLLL